MRRVSRQPALAVIATGLFMLALLPAPARAGGPVKATLSSPNAAEEASGTLELNGYDLSGHLSGGGIDVEIAGTAKNSGISVIVRGRIVPGCSLNQQTMSGEGENAAGATSIVMSFNCPSKASGAGGQSYVFRLDLRLPAPRPQNPSDADPGESAAIEPVSGEVQRNLA